MKIDSFKTFACIAECGSISLAARILHFSQPTVSAILSALEEELGCMLFYRKVGQRTPLQLTKEGEIFYEYTKSFISMHNNMLLELNNCSSDSDNSVSVCTSPTISADIMPVIFSSFTKIYPGIALHTSAYHGSYSHSKLLNNECDFVLSSRPSTSNLLESTKVLYDPVVLISSKIFNINDTITINKLKKIPIVIREPNCGISETIFRELGKHKIEQKDLNSAMQVYGNAAVINAIASGNCCGFVTYSSFLKANVNNDFKLIKVSSLKLDRFVYLLNRNVPNLPISQNIFKEFIIQNNWNNRMEIL